MALSQWNGRRLPHNELGSRKYRAGSNAPPLSETWFSRAFNILCTRSSPRDPFHAALDNKRGSKTGGVGVCSSSRVHLVFVLFNAGSYVTDIARTVCRIPGRVRHLNLNAVDFRREGDYTLSCWFIFHHE